jgi:hypothetical protein
MTVGSRKPKEEGEASREEDALRCGCGALLARVVPGGVELKCRRCRRCLVIRLDARGEVEISGELAGGVR